MLPHATKPDTRKYDSTRNFRSSSGGSPVPDLVADPRPQQDGFRRNGAPTREREDMRLANTRGALATLAVAAAGTVGALVAPVAAHADTTPAAITPAACVRSNLTTGFQGPGTVVNKASGTSCHDENLVFANDTSGFGFDNYAGFFRTSNGVWHIGSRGYQRANNGNVNFLVLLSDVISGTPMSVGSELDGGDGVTIAH
jgi:hypothetical protein